MTQGYATVSRWCDAQDAIRAIDTLYQHVWAWLWFSAFILFWKYVVSPLTKRGPE